MAHLSKHGASFSTGALLIGGLPRELRRSLDLVCRSADNDRSALRAYSAPPEPRGVSPSGTFRSRRLVPHHRYAGLCALTRRLATTWARPFAQILARHGSYSRCDCDRQLPVLSSRSIRCYAVSRKPAASGAVTSLRVSAPRSSRNRARSTCCAMRVKKKTMR